MINLCMARSTSYSPIMWQIGGIFSSVLVRIRLSNPLDSATVLLTIGGDSVCKTPDQLSSSPYGAHIAFSFVHSSYVLFLDPGFRGKR